MQVDPLSFSPRESSNRPSLSQSDKSLPESKDNSPRTSNNRYVPLRKGLERRTSISNFFVSDDRIIIGEKDTTPIPIELKTSRKNSFPVASIIPKALSSPADIGSPRIDAIHDQLVESYRYYSSTESQEKLKSSLKKVNVILKASPRQILPSQPSDKSGDLKRELDRVFTLIELGQTNGLSVINLPGKDAKQVRLDVLLEILLKNEAVKKGIEEDKELKVWAHLKIFRLILDDFYTNAHDVEDFLKTASPLFNDLVLIFGMLFEVNIKDDTQTLKIYERFVDKNNPALLLKKVKVALENFGKVFSAIQASEKSVKLTARGENVEFILHDPNLIYSNGMAIYKSLVPSLIPALQFTQETINSLISNIMNRYLLAGKASKEDISKIKEDFRRAWPAEDTRTNVKIDWSNVLKTLTHLVNIVKTDAGFFKRSEWIRKCLSDFSASDIKIHLYSCANELVRDPIDLFKGLSKDETENLKNFTEAKAAEIKTKCTGSGLKIALLKSKCESIKVLIG